MYLPDSVCVVGERLILPFPEDLWVGNPCDAAFQPHRMTLSHACVLQLLHKWWGLVHLFGCGESLLLSCSLSPNHANMHPLHTQPSAVTLYQPLFTCNNEFQVKWVLPSSVAGDAGVDASVTAGHGLDDQWVHAVFPHQHLVGGVGTDGLSVQLPDEVRGG